MEKLSCNYNRNIWGILFFICTILTSCTDELAPIAVSSVILDPISMTLIEGESQILTVTVSPSNAENKTVIWTSSNSSVASVKEGLVTAIKAGKTTVTVKSDDGGKTATCEVIVKEAIKTDISVLGTANCYIVSEAGFYKFTPSKGNSNKSVGTITSVEVLWETFGTDVTPNVGDLVKNAVYSDGYITFQTADTFKEGNAVIAAKAASGNILWSWHIWLTDEPQGQEYYNNAGTMMDRNLGATSATPGDVGALGLLYQWGRKDPFLGSSSISSDAVAKSTITWPLVVESNSTNGTIEYASANPTTFITRNSDNKDWYYTGNSSTDNTRWTESDKAKSIYDPCPQGWRVPDGGSNGVWSKSLGSSSSFSDKLLYDSTNEGMNFSGKFGLDQTIWYPASGFRDYSDGSLSNVGYDGGYWSASPNNYNACLLYFNHFGYVDPSNGLNRAYGFSVRCLQE